MSAYRFIRAAHLISIVTLSKIEESIQMATRTPRGVASDAAQQIGDAGAKASRRAAEVTGASLRAIGRTVTSLGDPQPASPPDEH